MVDAFSRIFNMSTAEGALVQTAFYGGYFAMAFPAAMFIRHFSYKHGVLVGLGLYAFGALLFFPAKQIGAFGGFLLAYFILTCGLSFLETSCNPYILTMGSEATATRRLNFAQSFNPMGSLCGMVTAMVFIQAQINKAPQAVRATWSPEKFNQVKDSDLSILIGPYLWIGLVILLMFILILIVKMPKNGDKNKEINFIPTLKRIFSMPHYRQGVFAQFCYVGAQIMCWTFVIQYGKYVLMSHPEALHSGLVHVSLAIMSLLSPETYQSITSAPVISEANAAVLSQMINIFAMIIFCCSRFICTFFLKFINAGKLLGILAIAAGCFVLGVIFFQDVKGLYCLVCVSACMSLMFPTIYGIALTGLGDDAKFGAAGLIMAILGGSVLTPIQGKLIDIKEIFGLPGVHVSFILPLLCFVVVMIYGFRRMKESQALKPETSD
jgi:FHS family L-fucose permease-like MFS transporter